ncbi:MAG: hypothetical protein JXA72_07055 [Bacteroidales bacterium]|nr:hypothetical protein [Bacteroidales bacterium]
MTIKTLLAGGMIMLLFACSGPEKLLSDASKDRIYFGKAGGFTNISTEYVLIEKYVYKREGEKFNMIRKLSGDQVKSINILVNAIDFSKLNLNEPGNMTYHIKLVKAGSVQEVKWSDTSENSKIKELYKALTSTLKE